MIHDVPKPEISPAFTIEDIHKIREWHYERLKDATSEEWWSDTTRRTEEAMKRVGAHYGVNKPHDADAVR
jgi:Mg2+ and Co2+ transporter CorA